MGTAHLCNIANNNTNDTTTTTTANLPEIKKEQKNQVMNKPLWVLTGNGGQGLLALCSASASTAHIRYASANVIRKVAVTAHTKVHKGRCIYIKCGLLDRLNNKPCKYF